MPAFQVRARFVPTTPTQLPQLMLAADAQRGSHGPRLPQLLASPPRTFGVVSCFPAARAAQARKESDPWRPGASKSLRSQLLRREGSLPQPEKLPLSFDEPCRSRTHALTQMRSNVPRDLAHLLSAVQLKTRDRDYLVACVFQLASLRRIVSLVGRRQVKIGVVFDDQFFRRPAQIGYVIRASRCRSRTTRQLNSVVELRQRNSEASLSHGKTQTQHEIGLTRGGRVGERIWQHPTRFRQPAHAGVLVHESLDLSRARQRSTRSEPRFARCVLAKRTAQSHAEFSRHRKRMRASRLNEAQFWRAHI